MEYLLHWRRTEPQAQGRASCTWLKGMVRVSPRRVFLSEFESLLVAKRCDFWVVNLFSSCSKQSCTTRKWSSTLSKVNFCVTCSPFFPPPFSTPF